VYSGLSDYNSHLVISEFSKMSVEKVFMNELVTDSIIKHLSLADVKNAALVCRSWRQQVECRQYWRSATLRIRDEAIFNSPRIQSVRRFKLDSSDTDAELVNLFFSFISDNNDYDVEFLRCDTVTLTTVPTQLATSLCKIAEVELIETKLSERQHHHLFRAIGQSSHLKLRKLVLDKLRLERVDPEILGLAIAKVEEITLTGWEVFKSYEAIFRNISTTAELHLQNLTINYECETEIFMISRVSPEILASAACRLKRCNLGSLEITTEQLEELCREIVISKNLPLSYLNLRNSFVVPDFRTDILASAVVRLEVVEISNSTDAQLHAILSKVVESNDSKLKELYLYEDLVDEEEPETRSLLLKVKDKMKIFKRDLDESYLKQVIV